jgi:DNA-binding transcriptional ArsR family regulator
MADDSRTLILGKLKENLRGMTISQLVEATKISRETVTKHLLALGYENEVYTVKYGNAEVFCSNHRKVRDKDTIRVNMGSRTLFINRLNNEFGDFIKIAETRKVGEKWEPKGSVIIPPDALPDVIKALESIEKRPNEINKENSS